MAENQNNLQYKSEIKFLEKYVCQVVLHPWYYAKFLAQIDHKSIVPEYFKNIYGESQLFYPNLMSYAKCIYSVNGLRGMYSGFVPKMFATYVEYHTSNLVSNYLQVYDIQNEDDEDSEIKIWKKCAITTLKEMFHATSTIILSHPFHVLSMRIMAQFIGQEQKYSGVFPSLFLIYREEGVTGLFSGLIPRLLADLSILIFLNVTRQVFSRYLKKSTSSILSIADVVAHIAINTATYPLRVVTACTAINNCRLSASMPPNMPVFGNWLECMKYLYRCNLLNRGSNTWFRHMSHSTFFKLL